MRWLSSIDYFSKSPIIQSPISQGKFIVTTYNREGGVVHLIAKYSNISHMVYGKTMQLGGCRCNWVK